MLKIKFLTPQLLPVMLLLSINVAHSQEVLIVYSKDAVRHVSTSLDNLQRLTFSSGDLSVKTLDGKTDVYALDNIVKLSFSNPSIISLEVIVYITPAGDVVVESSVAIQSLTIFAIDGKILRRTVVPRQPPSLQATVNVSNFSTGVYLLQIGTMQGAVVKKIIK